ncbi:MAG: cellulase family glycosylhydrolase [Luteolibacter sp.]|uniref:cellulase family glycosylhydrolase n=1 Tax=Luteolibacter sp. TaxID=1962973 RepID=UPI003263509A
MNIIFRRVILLFIVVSTASGLYAQTLTSIGAVAPSPGPNDISQLATSNTTWPDGLNYFTDNNPIAGQTFTTGSNPMNLVSLSVKTAGLNSGGGYGTPATTPTYYLRIYSISGSTATPLITFSSPNPGFTDGDWLKWSGMKVPLEANKTYAFSFGIKPSTGGWAALAVAANVYAGGEIAMIPTAGGTITTGASHSFDAAFALGLQAFPPALPATMPLPTPTYGFNLGNTFEATWGYPSPTQGVLVSAANAGFNAVRIPCAWNFNADPNTYQINPAYMAEVKQAVDWAIAAGMHVMINVHWDGGWMENNIGDTVDPVINAKLQSYWTQIATTFAGYDNRLLFAAANEPNVGSPAAMNTLMAYYQTFINTVRGVGGNNTNRWLVLQGGGDTAWFTTLPPDPTPGRLMVEYHCYSPSQFAILSEDASWGIAKYFWGPAYHYSGDPTRNCVAPEEGAIDSGFQQLKEQYIDKGIPVLIGEFGVAGKPTTGEAAAYSTASSLYWLKYVVDSAHSHGLSPFNWSTPSSLFDYATGAITNPDAVSVLTGGIAPPPPNGAPYAASGLTATTAGTGQVNLSWTAGSGATTYNLYRAAESGYGSSIAPVITGLTGTSYSDTGLNSGTTYYYQVVAVNSSGPSGFSPEAHATTPGVNPDPTQYHFETDTQRWSASGAQIAGIATSTAQHFAGNQSLAVSFNGTTAGTSSVNVSDVNVAPGTTITFRVWIPGGSAVTVIEPYLSDYNWAWASSWYGNLTANAWNTLTLTIPSGHTAPLKQLGLRLSTNGAWTGTCYMDSVAWTVPPATPPPAPASLVASAGNAQVGLTWSASSGATSYNVKRATVNGGPYTTITNVTGTSFTNTGLANGTTYYYVVSAVNASGESTNSGQASATPVAPPVAPPTPGGLAATAGNAQVGLTWNASSGATSYNVKRATVNGGPYSTVTSVTGTGFTDTGLVNGTTYYYVVSALNSGGESGNSTQASATPQAAAPPAPTGLAAAGGNTQVALTWNTASGATSYNVKRATVNGGPYTTITNITGTSFTNTGLANGTTYYYVVSALNAGSESGNSAQASATPQVSAPPAPAGLAATGGNTQVALTWNTASGATSYNVKRATVNGGPYTTITNLTGTSFTNTGLANGTTYYYVVSALNAGGESSNSAQASATPSAPSLPSPWATVDIGAVAATGSASASGGTFTVTGSGADIWDSADEFRYVHQPSSGNCEMSAQITSVQNTDPWAKAGVMIRESTAAGALYAAVFITPGNGVTFQRRTATGGTTVNTVVTGVTAPRYVRLQRAANNSFRAYYSSNGTNWTQIGSNQTISMASSATMGLAVTSHADGTLCTSTISNVTATP